MTPRVSGPRLETRDIYWRPWSAPGCEHVHVRVDENGAVTDGVILLRRGEGALRCHYRLTADALWHTRGLDLAVQLSEEPARDRMLNLASDGEGNWRIDGEPAPLLQGCLDVDIQVTPLTNTLPIRRLGLTEGHSAEIKVVYIPVPELTPRPAEQRYTCLKPVSAAGGLYRYEGLFRSFSAMLPVDSGGFVVDYPDTFRRIW